AKIALVPAVRHLADHGIEEAQAFVLDVLRHLIRPVGCGGMWAGRIGGSIAGVKANLFDQTYGIQKLLLALAREANYEVGRDGGIRHLVSDIRDKLAIEVRSIAPGHSPESPVVACLNGNVKVLAGIGHRGHGLDNLRLEISRMSGDKADAEQTIHPGPPFEQVPQMHGRVEIVPVGSYILSEQGDFLVAVGRQLFDFTHDLVRMAALFPPADVGNDAIRAVVIATVNDRHPCAYLVLPDYWHFRQVFRQLLEYFDDRPPVTARPQDQIG